MYLCVTIQSRCMVQKGETMRNPRRVKMIRHSIKENQLSTAPPPPDSLFWKLWDSSKSIAEDVMKTDLVKGLRSGSLDPIKFGAFNVSDAYYCFKQSDCFEMAEKRAENPVLKAFLGEKLKGYVDYNERFHKTWFLKDANGIVPPPICAEYSDFETQVSTQEDTIYTLILMLPCEYLWPWLSEKMLPVEPGNIYENWIKENLIPEIPYAVGNFLDMYQRAHPDSIDEEKAIKIYKQAMEYEYKYFVSVTE